MSTEFHVPTPVRRREAGPGPAYQPPIRDMSFVIADLIDLDQMAPLPAYHDLTTDLTVAVLAEAGKLGAEVLAPLNPVGDRAGCGFENGQVVTPPGFRQAYAQFVEGGWGAISAPADHGGQGLPWLVATAVSEIWHSANMAFGLCPLLTQGAVEALAVHGNARQKELYLPHLVSGRWTGTMNLTEPDAGSDLGRIRTKAWRDGDRYRLRGQKIFITYGDHDFAENIVHLVLARLEGAPPGPRGLSLFLVPKFLLDEQGRPAERNDLRCMSLEHKLGIHGSPTCVMSYGDGAGAIGELVGEENQGLAAMFTMMNNARLAVGLQGVAVAERALQAALAYAAERRQGHEAGQKDGAAVQIRRHPDVRRMLMDMRATTEAARALAYSAAAMLDLAHAHPDAEARAAAQSRVDLLIPVVKGWCTEAGVTVADLAVQVFGGAGFIEESGVAQYLRDVRITPIYEGTNGIQARDLVLRKIVRDGGAAAHSFIDELRGIVGDLEAATDSSLAAIGRGLAEATEALASATEWLLGHAAAPASLEAVATPYARLFGLVAAGGLMATSALKAFSAAAAGRNDPFLSGKVASARFFADNKLPFAQAFRGMVCNGAESVLAMDDGLF